MSFMRTLTTIASLACATLAHAESPDDILARTPSDAHIVVATPSISELDHAIGQLIAALELRTASTVSQALTILGLDHAVDTSRGIALAIAPDGAWALRIPTRSDTDLLTDLSAGLDTAPLPTGAHPIKLAGLQGFALRYQDNAIAIAPTPAAAQWMVAPSDHDPLPDPAAQLINGAPIFAIASRDALRTALANWGAESVTGDDVELVACALRVTGFGITLDAIAPAAPGSPLAAACKPNDGAAHHDLLRAMPASGYTLAASIDGAHPFTQFLLERLANSNSHARNIAASREALANLALTITTPDDWPRDRQLSQRIAARWSAGDPIALRDAFDTAASSYIESLEGRWSLKSNDAGDITWLLQAPKPFAPFSWLDRLSTFPLPPPSRPITMMGLGHIDENAGRAVAGKRSPFTELHLSTSPTPTLADDTILAQMPRVLPGPRDAELYLEMRPFLEALAPFFAANKIDTELPDWLAPLGFALDASSGHPRARVFIQMGVLRIPAEFALQRAMDAMGAAK